ncbi:hypothetical protein [Marinobacter salicampi]|uniref:hypothetical protein n=1 Tax=Marinobacter salicampi TaxID=435907 RepID=UPI00140D60A2|nr:hypothetical protein [Marinobacter salicampi]
MDGNRLISNRERGASTTEYLIGTSAMVAALFLPVPGLGGESAVTLLINAFKDNHHGYIWSMSYPF